MLSIFTRSRPLYQARTIGSSFVELFRPLSSSSSGRLPPPQTPHDARQSFRRSSPTDLSRYAPPRNENHSWRKFSSIVGDAEGAAKLWPATVKGRPSKDDEPRTAKITLRNLKSGAKKINRVARIVRRYPVDKAKIQMRLINLKPTKFLLQAIVLAEERFEKDHGEAGRKDRLIVDEAWIGIAHQRKKLWIHARGKHGIRKMYRSHLTVVLREVSDEEWKELTQSSYRHGLFKPTAQPPARIPENLVKPWLIRNQMDVVLSEVKAKLASKQT